MPIRIARISPLPFVIAAVLAGCAGRLHARAESVPALLDDGFDGENRERPALMYDGFAQWQVEDGTVDLVGVGSDWDFHPGNGLYVDLDGDRPDGSRFAPGVLVSREAFPLRRGEYELTFRLGGSRRGDTNTVVVALGDVYRERFTLPSEAPFHTYLRMIRVTGPREARLSFDNAGADGFGLLLDDVRLRRVR
ncbi:MAG TPA: hypothetical protein VLK84_11460 [Longimicrobium sp.]|nr:hypothetical protein [Longimicrobium sp.]